MVRAMYEEKTIWANQSRWPRDTNDFIFLCRAVFQVGRALYPDDWTDTDFQINPVNKLPSRSSGLSDGALRSVYSVLRSRRPELNLPILTDSLYRQVTPEFTDDLWSLAVELFDKLNADTKAPGERFKTAKSKLFEALAVGAVIYCLRPKPGGEFSYSCPAAWWNTERWAIRFATGQMNPKEPFSTAFAGDKFQWIFIKADSLQAFLKSLNHTLQTTAGGEAMCKSALIAEMSKSPTTKPRPKEQFMAEMMENYTVSKRGFDRAWSEALLHTGATWDKAGRSKQSQQ